MTLLSIPDMSCGHCKASVTEALDLLHMLVDGYIVRQTLRCSEYYSNEGAWWGSVEQMVLLDADGSVRGVLVSTAVQIIS